MSSRSEILIGFFLLFLAQAMVGLNIVGTKYLVTSVSFLCLLTIRFTLASILLFILHLGTHKKPYRLSESTLTLKAWAFIIAQALCAGLFFNLLMIWGLQYTDANIAGIITSALPALTAFLSCIIFRKEFTAPLIFCIFFATLGLLLVSFQHLHGLQFNTSAWGMLLIFLALFPEASYYILSKYHKNTLPVFLVSALLNGINAIILIPIFFIWQLHFQSENNLTLFQWILLAGIGLTTGLFFVFWYLGSEKVDVVKSALSTALMPITTVILSWLFLGELINTMEIIGMGLVIGSIVLYVLA